MNSTIYEPTIGLEVHIQLSTATKSYSEDAAEYFNTEPNTHLSDVTLALPGALPVFNEKVLEYAVMLGKACKSTIHHYNGFARKNYFYYDLPKGYQISQDKKQICSGGYIQYRDKEQNFKKIELTRIHIEEDAGKSINDLDPFNTLVDLNRCGIPLLEIVSEPVIKSSEEAVLFLNALRDLVRYLGVSDGNMDEGSMRCDVNVSVCPQGSKTLGERVEIKNMNSFRGVATAIKYEIERQSEEKEKGNTISQETRTFHAATGKTKRLRSKEDAQDYRYFPDPDLPPVIIDDVYISEIEKTIPHLPDELFVELTEKRGLSAYDAELIIKTKAFSDYYFEIIKHTKNYKSAANWMNVNIRGYLNQAGISLEQFSIKPQTIAGIIQLIDDDTIPHSSATQKLFPELLKQKSNDFMAVCESLELIADQPAEELDGMIQNILEAYPDKVEAYKGGKVGLKGFFVGNVMKQTQGKANPQLINKLLDKYLNV